MAQTAEKLSDYYEHVKTYFSISQKEIDDLSEEFKEGLPKKLGPLKRPPTSVRNFLDSKSTEENDLIVKILGLGQVHSYTSQKGKGYYQRILAADESGEIEFVTFRINLHSLGDLIRVAGIHHFTSKNGREQLRISRTGGIFPVPFNLPLIDLTQTVINPDKIDIKNLPTNYVSLKAIILEKGELEVRKERFGEGSYSTLRIVVCAKKQKLNVYLQRQLAADVSKNTSIHEVILLTNINIKPSRGQIVAYSSDYSSFQNKTVEDYTEPEDLSPIYLPIQKTDLVTLCQNPYVIGEVRGLLTDPVKQEGKYGEYYLSGFVDSSGAGSITFNEETIKKIPKSTQDIQQVTIHGVLHSNKDYFKLDGDRLSIMNDSSPLAPAIISGSEVMEMDGLFCVEGKVEEIYEPREFTMKDGRSDTMQRVRFDCQGNYYSITGFNKEDRTKLYDLKLNNSYQIMFVRKDIYNDFVSLKFSPFTKFQLSEESSGELSDNNYNIDVDY